MRNGIMLKRLALLSIVLLATVAQSGCGYVAAGAVGAAIGHEVAEREDKDRDDDRD